MPGTTACAIACASDVGRAGLFAGKPAPTGISLDLRAAGFLWEVLAEAVRGQAERFDAFAGLPHYPFPGGQMLRVPFSAIGAWYYSLRDRLGF